MKRYLVIMEPTKSGLSAYAPDLPGCIAAGKTRADVEQAIRGAIGLHIDGLQQEGIEVPEPQSYSTYVELPA